MADRNRFEELALPHMNAVYRAAVAMCGQANKAEDLAQTTFVKALERFESFQPDTNCRAWLLRILRNTWFDELRHRKVVGTTVPVDEHLLEGKPKEAPVPWTEVENIMEAFSDEQVIRALGELPEEQRLTLFLVDVEGLDQEEVAAVMEVAVGTVKSRSSRARAALRERLQAHAKDLGLLGRRK